MNQSIKKLLFSIFAITTITFNLNCMVDKTQTDFCEIDEHQTPRRPKRPHIELESVHKLTLPAENFCRQIIDDLQQDRPEQALEKLPTIYAKLPKTLMKTKWKFKDEADPEEEKTKYYKNTNLSILYTMFLCLSQFVNSQDPQQTITINNNSASLTIGKYKITFTINGTNKDLNIKQIDKIDFKIKPYTTTNFVKQTLFNLIDQDYTDMVTLGANLTDILNKIPYNIQENKEQYYQTIIYTIVLFMGSNASVLEAYAGDGRADLVLRAPFQRTDTLHNCIIEFKLNNSAQTAQRQILETNYAHYFCNEKVKALGININVRFDKPKNNPERKINSVNVTCSQEPIHFTSPQPQQTGQDEYSLSF